MKMKYIFLLLWVCVVQLYAQQTPAVNGGGTFSYQSDQIHMSGMIGEPFLGGPSTLLVNNDKLIRTGFPYAPIYAKDPFASFTEYETPVELRLSASLDTLTMTVFRGNVSVPDTSVTLLDMRLSYFDEESALDLDLVIATLDQGVTLTHQLSQGVVDCGTLFLRGNQFAVYKWAIDPSQFSRTDEIDFRFDATWKTVIDGEAIVDSLKHNPLEIPYKGFDIPESFYTNVPFVLNTNVVEGASAWNWSLDGEVFTQERLSPVFQYAEVGTHSLSLQIDFEDGTQSSYTFDDIVVQELPELSLSDNFIDSSFNTHTYSFDLTTSGSIGDVEYLFDGLRISGVYLDSESGEFYWKEARTGLYDFTLKIKDDFNGYVREVERDYLLTVRPNTSLSISDTVYEGFPFEISKATDYDAADMWIWRLDTQDDVYSMHTQIYTINQPGVYPFTLTPALKRYEKGYDEQVAFQKQMNVVVAPIPEGFMQVTNDVVEEVVVLDVFTSFTAQFESNMPRGFSRLTIANMPNDASFNELSGLLRWDRVISGDYAIEVTAHRTGSDEITTKLLNIHVNPPTFSDITFHVFNQKNEDLAEAMIIFNDTLVQTDANGLVTLPLMDLNEFEYTVSHPTCMPVSKSIFVSNNNVTVESPLSSTTLILQNVKFTAGDIDRDRSMSKMVDSVMINDMILFEGDDTVFVDRSSDVMPIIITKNKVKFVGESSSTYIINNNNEKRFFLYQGMLIPDFGCTFDLGDVGGIPFDGHMMSFFADQDADGLVEEFGVEFAVFPRLPWIIGDYVTGAGYAMRTLVLDLLRAGNIDVNDYFETQEGSIAYSPRDSTVETEGDQPTVQNAAYPDSSMTSLLSRIKALPVGMPNIEVIKRMGYTDGESHTIAMSDLSICYKALGFEGLGVTYEYNKQSQKTTWGGSAYLKFGAKCKKSSSSATRSGEVATYGEIEYMLESSFADYPEIEDVDIELLDDKGVVVYESSYGEFVDISDEIIEGEYDLENRLLKGIGVEILIIDGQLDKILLSADMSLPLGPVTIKNLNGGIEGLSPGNDLTLTFGATMTMTGNPFIKFKDLKATVTPWSYYGFSGKLELYRSELIYADMSYDNNRSQFYVGGELIPSATRGVITGRVEIGLGARGIGGNAKCNVKTPSDLPWGFGWAANRVVGSAAVGFSDRYVGARVSLGKEVTIEVQEEVRWGFRSVFRSACDYVKEAAVSIVRFVTKIVKSMINFDLSIGYDFQEDRVLFGNNVRIPAAIRMCYRGDTLVQDFVVPDPVKFLYITSTCTDTGFVRFDIFDPNDRLVRSEAIWCRDSSNNEIMAVVMYPEIGTWRVKADTAGYAGVILSSMYVDSEPQGLFESPLVADTTSTQVLVRFNDINDTLDVGIFIDDDRDGYNGSLLKELKVLNKASLKFTYAPRSLEPGEYYFYYTVTDGSGVPSYKYADGSLVILPSNQENPIAVKSSSEEDVLTISWQAVDIDKVDYVSVEITDMKTGTSIIKDVWDSSFVAFDSLMMSHTYEYVVTNRSTEFGISAGVTGDAFIFSTIVNNPPKWNMAEGAYFEMYELDTFSLTLDVEDPEGGALTIVNITEPLPKSFELIDGEITWMPDVEERGIYEFEFVASDGLLNDTLRAVFEVKAQTAAVVSIDFASTKLYEEDNMFLILNDAESEDSLKIAWLYNISKNDSILVEMSRSDEETYMGHFQLSYQRRSILPVSNGDTLIAKYTDLVDTTYAIAFFDSLPQLADNIAPDAITDLVVTNMGDFVSVSFTVPEDRMDNNMIANPFYYDLRYAYQELDNEEIYLGSFSIESYNAGVPGTRDTIFFDLAALLDYGTAHRVWFNVKAGDPNYNVSDMSNTVSMDYVIAPTNLLAELQASLKGVDLVWDAPECLADDDYLLKYEVYRKIGAQNYELIGFSGVTSFEDDFTNPVTDGVLSYAVRAVYSSMLTDFIYSDAVEYDKLSNVRVKCYDERNLRDDNSIIEYHIFTLENRLVISGELNADGQFYLEDFENGAYLLELSSGANIYITDTIEVSSRRSYFEYVIQQSIVTGLAPSISSCELVLFPNPVDDQLLVKVPKLMDQTQLAIFDMCGGLVSVVFIPREVGLSQQIHSVDVSSLVEGVYLLKAVGVDGQVIIKRFVKK